MFNKLNYFLHRKFKIQLILLILAGLVVSFLELLGIGLIPYFIGVITDKQKFLDLLPFSNLKSYFYNLNDLNLFLFFSFSIVSMFIIKNILIFLLNFFENKVYLNIVVYNSSKLLRYYINSPFHLHLDRNSSKFIRNLSHDTEASGDLIHSMIKIFRDILMCILIISLLIATNPLIAIISIASLSLFAFLVYFFIKGKIENFGKSTRNFLSSKIQVLSDAFSAIKEIKVIGNESKVFLNYDKTLIGYHEMKAKFNVLSVLPRLSLEFMAVSILVCIVIIFNSQSNSGIQTFLPNLTLITIAIIKLSPLINNIISSLSSISYSKSCMESVYNEFIKLNNEPDQKNEINDQKTENDFEEEIKIIEFKKVNYRYPNTLNNVLNNVNFKIFPNQVVGIIGATGSGKTTLVDLLLGLLDPSEGNILINDSDLKLDKKKFRNLMSYVPQNPFIYNDNILNNIIFQNQNNYKNLEDQKKLDQILDICQLNEFVDKLPKKILENSGNLGIKFSGGQRQRLAIARALYLDRKIIVLDEATNALDIKTEEKILNKIYKLKKDKIIINISHKINETINYDNLLVLDHNRIIDNGPYQNLKESTKNLYFNKL